VSTGGSGELSLLTASLRCSRVARANQYLPGGTAAAAAAFVMVETPLPWPHDVGSHPLLEPLAPVLKAHAARLQAIVPVDGSDADRTRIVVQRRPQGRFRTFERIERAVPTARLTEEVEALLTAAVPADEAPATDVLVCTHGSRDVCCGADGMRLYTELVRAGLPNVRVWRTSHTGGHRFAPTAVTFPDGRAWAWLDVELLRGITERSLSAAEAAVHDRGCVAFDDPFVQAADGAVLGAAGWSWLDRARSATVEGSDGVRQVTLTGEAPDGSTVSYRAEVAVSRVLPVPDCGRPLEEARKSSPELEIRGLLQL
jgi:hypothetical protein